ncbi:hypothetical protein [Micromonospora parva]|uniref:hypothetical protein n=1 Tax=Micromonospora parva TaxID=1464048 RepID=UPI0033E15AE5
MAPPQASAAALPQLKAAIPAQSLIRSGLSFELYHFDIQLGLDKRQATEVTTRSDISEIKDKMTFSFDDEGCERVGDVVTCREYARFGLGASQTASAFGYAPPHGSTLPSGVVGTVRTTVEVKGYAPANVQTEIIAVDQLTVERVGMPTLTAAPGDTVTARFGFKVSGTVPARGVVLDFRDGGPGGGVQDLSSGLWPAEAVDRFSNCSYNGVELLWCRFDQEFAPGRTFVVPVRVKVRADSGKKLSLFAGIQPSSVRLPKIEAVRAVAPTELGVPGGGPKLVVDNAPAVTEAALQWFEASAEQTIQTDSKLTSDYEKVKLFASTVYYQKKGDVAPLEVGFVNGGEAVSRDPLLLVQIPFRTKAIAVPESCFGIIPHMDYVEPALTSPAPLGLEQYLCGWRGVVGNGQRLSLKFSLRVEYDNAYGGEVRRYPFDFSEKSNVAISVVKGTPPTPSPSASATPSPGPSGSAPATATPTPSGSASVPGAASPSSPASGAGGGLPLTGLPLVTFGAVGVGMLVVGFLLLHYGRRKRLSIRSE